MRLVAGLLALAVGSVVPAWGVGGRLLRSLSKRAARPGGRCCCSRVVEVGRNDPRLFDEVLDWLGPQTSSSLASTACGT